MSIANRWAMVLVFAIASTSLPAQSEERAAPIPPRYSLVPGQELTYRLTSSIRYWRGDKASLIEHRSDITLWIVRPNADGSFRMLFALN